MKKLLFTFTAMLLSIISFAQGSEDFTNCGTASSYGTRSWTGTNASWTATDARADQTITGKAITIRNGSLTSTSTIPGGIKQLTVSTQRKFTGGSGTFDLEINGNYVSTIAYGDNVQTIVVDNIDVAGNIVIAFTNKTSTSDRVAIDDLSWTSYSVPVGPVITLGSSNVASEAAGTVITLTATASEIVTAGGTVNVDISGTGITGTDYSLSNSTITIPAGASSGSVTLTILDDSDVEGTETLIATINTPSLGLNIGSPDSQLIEIQDNDFNPDVSLSADITSGTEVGTTVITLTATANMAVTGAQTVDLTVSGTNITAGDYSLSSSVITIPSGQTTGTATFTITDDSDLEGNETATITISNPSSGITVVAPLSVDIEILDDDLILYDLIINEVLADPSNAGLDGDANNDGVNDFIEDEFVEIYNNESFAVDMSGYTMHDASLRHTFPAGTIVPANSFITVFGGGTPTNIPGIAQPSSTGNIGLSNSGDDVYIYDANGFLVTSFSYTGSGGNNQSFARYPDFTGSFVDHTGIPVAGREYSPGIENESVTTVIDPTVCGTTLSYLFSEYYSAVPVAGAEEYEFRIDDGAGMVATYNTGTADSNRFYNFGSGTYTYNNSYAADVRVKVSGVWQPYGAACTINTGAPITELVNCNGTLSYLTENIFAKTVALQMGYRFEVSAGGMPIDTIVSSTRYFNLGSLSTGAVYGTTYAVRVSVNIGGTWEAFGSSCNVSTPALTTTQLTSTYCNTTVSGVGINIWADPIVGAQEYEFTITPSGGGASQSATNTDRRINLINYSLDYGTQYDVTVRVKVNGTYGNAGSVCTITTPALPTTQLTSTYCNTTVSGLGVNIWADLVSGADEYEFTLTPTSGGVSQSATNTDRRINLVEYSLEYGTQYDVSVRIKVNGVYGVAGTVCTITTPSLPTTKLRAAYCNSTLPSTGVNIKADGIVGATGYRFRITESGMSEVHDSPNSRINLLNYTLVEGVVYDVDVAVELNGVYGAYGDICTITIPSQSARTINGDVAINNETMEKSLVDEVTGFEAALYPNPFDNFIRLELNSEDRVTPITVNVFDATGRLIEVREVNLDASETIDFGHDFKSGIYLVHITQNDQKEIIRIVKD